MILQKQHSIGSLLKFQQFTFQVFLTLYLLVLVVCKITVLFDKLFASQKRMIFFGKSM